jgi:hypothetical protein
MQNKSSLKVWEQEEIIVERTKKIRRLSFKNLAYELAEAFNIDKGLVYTFKGLCIRPTATIRDYLDDKRDLVTNPIKYFLLIVGTTIFIGTQTGYYENNVDFVKGIEEGINFSNNDNDLDNDENLAKRQKLVDTVKSAYFDYFLPYQNIWTALTISFSSFFSFLFFRKSGFNYVEHNAINTYLYVHTYLIMSLIIIFNLNMDFWYFPYFLYYIIMSVFIYKGLFQNSWLKTVFKTMLTFISSIFVFMIILFILGIIFAVYTIKNGN